jgi:4-amino-4-deoxy-L-arabinose transferase-like glycosyltransferase
MSTAFRYHDMLAAGNLLGPFTSPSVYPVLGHLVGALAAFVGGVNVAAPIVGENIVFVPLLALGCYQTGRLLFGPLAGVLAVLFVLGSPLLISMFHVFILDAPLAAAVAVSVWLVLASEDFSRTGTSALAGLAVGLGMNVKAQFVLFLAGLVLVVLVHGGWRNRRGFAAFAAVALLVGAPWYLVHFSELGSMLELASGGGGTPPGNIPPTLSTENLTWYFWSVLNSQLLGPLFVLAAGGTIWTLVTVVRNRGSSGARLEFLAAGFLAWLVITFVTAHHDIRYGLPLLAYVAVIATGWIVDMPRLARLAAIALLLLGVSANTLGIDFGVGGEAKLSFANPLPGEHFPAQVVFFSTSGFLASAPSSDGDVPGLLEALGREGVRTVTWSVAQTRLPDFSSAGLTPLARIAGMSSALTRKLEYTESATVATLIHEPVTGSTAAPCTMLSDYTGVWVVRFDAAAGKFGFYCPTGGRGYYDLGVVS